MAAETCLRVERSAFPERFAVQRARFAAGIEEHRGLIGGSALYLVGALTLALLGLWFGLKAMEMVGFLLLAGTFIPLPFDLYVLHVTPLYGLMFLAVFAAAVNTVAVLAERWFLLRVMAAGRGRRIAMSVRASRLSRGFNKAPFVMLFVGGCTFLPFEPLRFLAVVNGYSVRRYALATFTGRGVRFGLLVVIGDYLLGLRWLDAALLVVFGIYLLSLWDVRRLKVLWDRTLEDPVPVIA